MKNRHLLFTALLVLVHASRGASQNPVPQIRVDVDLVSLELDVFDQQGRFRGELAAKDFQVFEDRTLREIRNFSVVEAPYRTLALADCSGSVAAHYELVGSVLTYLAEGLRPIDYLGIVSFGAGVETLLDWTPKSRWVKNPALPENVSRCTKTDFYGSVRAGVEHVSKLPGRNAIVIVSDGVHSALPLREVNRPARYTVWRIEDQANDPAFQTLAKAVETAKVPLFFVILNSDLNPVALNPVLQPSTAYSPLAIYNQQLVRSRLEHLAAISGGATVAPQAPWEAAPLFEEAQRRLGYTYSLGFVPSSPGDGKVHTIEVRPVDRTLSVRQSRTTFGPPR